jgi:carboxymethylenebutenolidase
MPVYESKRVEYDIVSGHVSIMLEDGSPLPAYWSHPNIGGTFPCIAFIHDWWGIRPLERRLAQSLAQAGYYVVVPDLFFGATADTPQEAIQLVESLGANGFPEVDASLQAIEQHQRSNHRVAAVGLGMGGSLAYEAAVKRPDLEAAIACYGFPQRFMGQFRHAHAPILAIYGEHEPYTRPGVIKKLREELAESPLAHEVHIVADEAREFFDEADAGARQAWALMLAFLEKHLLRPLPKSYA